MSDHHLFPFTPHGLLEEALDQPNALHPDLVLLGGDYVCADVESIFKLAPILGCSTPKYGVSAVQGNYDCVLGPVVNRGLHAGPSAGHLFLAGLDSVPGGVPDPNPRVWKLPGGRRGAGACARTGLFPCHGPGHLGRRAAFRP